ncbi:hypothetical protein DID78_05410 [Candidatus Marinamargulisbacteria bacterium SCGC AG-343-D04]|nr:hypothetical protein DID78_05410 [Candidatus Marinamargulisbacteria bacterium SCGC AG-343-D04]
MLDNSIIQELDTHLKNCKKVLITGHRFPDTDSVGSCLALAHHLHAQGKIVQVWIPGEQINDFHYLPSNDFLTSTIEPDYFYDLCIVCDCSALDRVNKHLFIKNARHPFTLVNIDHHPDNCAFGDINCATKVSSVGELLFYIFTQLQWEITKDIAICLYAAISFDTGRFAYSNVEAHTFKAAMTLMEKGVDTYSLCQAMDENKTAVDFELIKVAIDNLVVVEEKNYAYTVIPKDAPRGKVKVIDFIRQLKDCDCFIVFQELQNKLVKVNLRSKHIVNVSELSHRFDGGGHERAAGILFKSDLDSAKKELFAALDELDHEA